MATARRCLGPAVAIWLVAGCMAAPGSAVPTATLPAPSPSTAEVSPSTVAPAPPAVDRPPDARLAAEGGDPVVGQLGTYTWGSGGSDSPWLPGTPIAVGAGEPLSLAFEPPVRVESWRARAVPSSADGPAGAAGLGMGFGMPVFAAPGVGTWTVEVRVVFADGAGDASYFWKIEVR